MNVNQVVLECTEASIHVYVFLLFISFSNPLQSLARPCLSPWKISAHFRRDHFTVCYRAQKEVWGSRLLFRSDISANQSQRTPCSNSPMLLISPHHKHWPQPAFVVSLRCTRRKTRHISNVMNDTERPLTLEHKLPKDVEFAKSNIYLGPSSDCKSYTDSLLQLYYSCQQHTHAHTHTHGCTHTTEQQQSCVLISRWKCLKEKSVRGFDSVHTASPRDS